jgi:hypothetical protein
MAMVLAGHSTSIAADRALVIEVSQPVIRQPRGDDLYMLVACASNVVRLLPRQREFG